MSLTSACYGKDLVRVLRVVRHADKHDTGDAGVAGTGPVHDVAEYNVRVLVEGDIDASYTKSDNGVVVATDSMKNIIYYLAKCSPHVLTPELFATHIGAFLLGKYAHLKRTQVDVERLRWSRIVLGEDEDMRKDGTKVAHKHSFIRDGDEKHIARVEVSKRDDQALDIKLTAGIIDLLVLKSSGSSFENFIRDEFTTLPEAADRILSTAVDMEYEFPAWRLGGEVGKVEGQKDILADVKQMGNTGAVVGAGDKGVKGDIVGLIGEMGAMLDVWGAVKKAREVTLRVFCEGSASVQATLYDMARTLLDAHETVEQVSYVLPNKHYIGVDMRYIGLINDGEVFMPIATPSGRITATVSRHGAAEARR